MSFINGLANSNLGSSLQSAAGSYHDQTAVTNAQNSVDTNAPAMASQASNDVNSDLAVQAMTPDQLNAGLTGQNPAAGIPVPHPMADASHPFWNVMSAVAGHQPAQTGAIPGQPQALENGGPVTDSNGNVIKKSTTGELLVQGVKELGQHIFGGGAAGKAADQVSQHNDDASNASKNGYQNGGVVALNHGSPTTRPEFTSGPVIPTGPNSGIVPASTEGQVLTMDAGGVVPDGFTNPMGGPTPAVSGAAAGLAQGFAQGQVLGRNLYNAYRQREANNARADYAGNLVDIDSGNQGQAPADSQEGMLGHARSAVEDFFHHLHSGTLNDAHVPNSDVGVPPAGAGAQPAAGGTPPPPGGQGAPAPAGQAIPAAAAGPAPVPPAGSGQGAGPQPAPAAPNPAIPTGAAPAAASAPAPTPAASAQKVATGIAAQAASQDPAANAGIPQESPEESGKPHSLTPDYWQQSQKLLKAAVQKSARAGEDPQKVYDSLTAMRNAHFQGQILRQLSAANTALLSGDEGSVKQALKNVNYYLPNGQGMTFRNATAGDVAADTTGATKPGMLMYRNPMYGLYGHQGEPEYTSVTPQHLQLIGAAALDPRTVQETMLKTYSAQAQAQKEQMSAQGELYTGQGRLLWGQAAADKQTLDRQMLPVEKYMKFASGEKNEAMANYYNRKQDKGAVGAGPKVTMAAVQKAQTEAMANFDSTAQGQFTTAPLTLPGGGESMSAAAGKSVHDPSRIPTLFQGLSPDQQQAGKALAGSFASANVGTVNAAEAAEMAARVVRAEGAKTPPTHMDPTTKSVVRDVIYDPAKNSVHVWVGNGWKNMYLRPNVIDAGDSPDQGIPTDGGDDAAMNSDDNAPAKDSQNMN